MEVLNIGFKSTTCEHVNMFTYVVNIHAHRHAFGENVCLVTCACLSLKCTLLLTSSSSIHRSSQASETPRPSANHGGKSNKASRVQT